MFLPAMVHIHRYLVFVDLSSLPQLTKAFIPDLLVKDIKRLHRTTDGTRLNRRKSLVT